MLAPGMECFGCHSHDRLPLLSCWNRLSLSPSRTSIPEMGQKCDRFQAFLGAFSIYFGVRSANLAKKRDKKRKKSSSRCRAILCGKTDSLKALDSVADYLENSHFHPINDSGYGLFRKATLGFGQNRLATISSHEM